MRKVTVEHEVYEWKELTKEAQKKAMMQFLRFIVNRIPELGGVMEFLCFVVKKIPELKALYIRNKQKEGYLLYNSLTEQLYKDYKGDEQTLRRMNEKFYYKDGSLLSEEVNIKAHQKGQQS
jgi:hypothetical protein